MKKSTCAVLLGLLLVSIVAGRVAEAVEEKTTLRLVTFLPASEVTGEIPKWFAKEVEKRSNGTLLIDFRGGPEVIPTFEQVEAVRTGVIDLNLNIGGYIGGTVPEAPFSSAVKHPAWVSRKIGLFDYWVEIYQKHGLRYLGDWISCWPGEGGICLFLNKKVQKKEDLRGLRFRSAPNYSPVFKALGITEVMMPASDIYLALQRKEIDGTGWPVWAGAYQMALHEVTKFAIDHGFFGGGGVFIMNPSSWNRLPKKQQDILASAAADAERIGYDVIIRETTGQRQKLSAGGVEFIKFQQDEAERYLKLAYDSMYEVMRKKLPPEINEKLYKLLSSSGS